MEMTKEELLAALAEIEEHDPAADVEVTKVVNVRGVDIVLDEARVTSWPTMKKLAAMQKAIDGGKVDYTALVLWMDVVTEACGLDEEQVLQMAGGHYADVAQVAEVLQEITAAVFPKKS